MNTNFLFIAPINSFNYTAFIFVSLLAISYGYFKWFPERKNVGNHWNLFRVLQIIGMIGYGTYLGCELPVLQTKIEKTDRSLGNFLEFMGPLLITTVLAFVCIFLASFGITKLWIIICKKKISVISGEQQKYAGDELRMIDDEHYKELLIRSEYASFFKEYVNDDWNRNNPFIDIIETEQNIFFSRSKHEFVYPLKTQIGELPLTDTEKSQLKALFNMDYEIIKELPLGKYLMNISWLKSYSEHRENKSPEEYYKWVFKINN